MANKLIPIKLNLGCGNDIKEGYYKFPKHTNLEKLAKLNNISKETFFEHLAKAESKVIPFLTENM